MREERSAYGLSERMSQVPLKRGQTTKNNALGKAAFGVGRGIFFQKGRKIADYSKGGGTKLWFEKSFYKLGKRGKKKKTKKTRSNGRGCDFKRDIRQNIRSESFIFSCCRRWSM